MARRKLLVKKAPLYEGFRGALSWLKSSVRNFRRSNLEAHDYERPNQGAGCQDAECHVERPCALKNKTYGQAAKTYSTLTPEGIRYDPGAVASWEGFYRQSKGEG